MLFKSLLDDVFNLSWRFLPLVKRFVQRCFDDYLHLLFDECLPCVLTMFTILFDDVLRFVWRCFTTWVDDVCPTCFALCCEFWEVVCCVCSFVQCVAEKVNGWESRWGVLADIINISASVDAPDMVGAHLLFPRFRSSRLACEFSCSPPHSSRKIFMTGLDFIAGAYL
jgi:hypothetical protein